MELAILFILLVFANLVWNHFTADPPSITTDRRTSKSDQTTKQPKSNDNQPTVLIRTTESDNPIKYSNQFCTAQEKSEHMQSQYWFDLKQYRLALANYVCESCGTSGPLELHHVDYSNLLAENINDVRVICRQCHQTVHNRLGYSRETYYSIKDLT